MTMQDVEEAENAFGSKQRPRRRWTRRLRSRPGQLVAVGLAGALLGATLTAWRTDGLPWSGDKDQALCWSALTLRDAEEMFVPEVSISAEEITPVLMDDGDDGPYGLCRIVLSRHGRPDSALEFRLHQPDMQYDPQAEGWAETFLSPQAVSFGNDVVGMVSESRAWLALPRQCADGSLNDAPSVLDVSWGKLPLTDAPNRKFRDRLARATVKLANAALSELGCDGAFPIPGRLPAPPVPVDTKPGRICDVEGLTLPAAWAEKESYELQGGTLLAHVPGTARVCGVGNDVDGSRLRLITIEDARLTEMFGDLPSWGGPTAHDKRGNSMVRTDLALYRTSCQTGDVLFAVQDTKPRSGDIPRRLLRPYVEAEAERLGCGKLTMKLPR